MDTRVPPTSSFFRLSDLFVRTLVMGTQRPDEVALSKYREAVAHGVHCDSCSRCRTFRSLTRIAQQHPAWFPREVSSLLLEQAG